MKTQRRSLLLLLATTIASWYGMMIVHESGHVLAAWLSGGHVARVVLHPLSFSRTDLSSNPSPLFVAASGPAWGALAPLGVWIIARSLHARHALLARAFAGFCLIANGAYALSAAVLPVGDAEDLLNLGVPTWALAVPGLLACAGGLALWNGMAQKFRFGNLERTPSEPPAAAASALRIALTAMLLTLTITLCAWWFTS